MSAHRVLANGQQLVLSKKKRLAIGKMRMPCLTTADAPPPRAHLVHRTRATCAAFFLSYIMRFNESREPCFAASPGRQRAAMVALVAECPEGCPNSREFTTYCYFDRSAWPYASRDGATAACYDV